MPRPAPDSDEAVRANEYPGWVFYVSFALIVFEALTLVTSTVWQPRAPSWAHEILDKRGELLAVAAAITMLLALILTFRPTGLAKYAAIGSGLLSFAAAANSIEIKTVHTALALFGIVLPIYVLSFPSLKWPEGWYGWLQYLSVMYFFSLLTLMVMISIKPVRDQVVSAGVDELSDLVILSVSGGILVTMLMIGSNLMAELTVGIYSDHVAPIVNKKLSFFSGAAGSLWPRRRRNRASRRRDRRGG